MKCPVCSEEFGYLRLKDLEKTKKETLFHCPKCSQKLSNSSLLEIQRKVDFFIYGGLVFLMVVLGIEYIVSGESMSTVSTILIMTICPISLLLGYLQIKKIDTAEYRKAGEKNAI
ncbi:hypothetical protein KO537_07785 [Shewanella sp. NKUCC01_JLK]|uniref:hypothetical protein n=1 Tax=Shewanella sp. NKUCC01_JLK TaxID=2842123 RepID=UPI001C5B27CB|nr:hypothetical protein [Shewanella sp. NKUCC01_JLK]MBW3514620.1 hypothetical protein [Shewanella sp. NKUCC01_JLK]